MTSALPTLLFTPVLSHLPLRQAGSAEGVFRLQTPARTLTAPARPKLNVSVALDMSGSMHGTPFSAARQALIRFLDLLSDDDRIALVTYNDRAEVVVPSMPVVEARKILQARLAQLAPSGCTALHAGWLKAAEQAAPHVGPSVLSRILLLSDGNANVGVKNSEILEQEARQVAATGLSTSTYGVGLHFNEELMTRMAVDGKAVFAESAEELEGFFAQEYALMSTIVGTDVQVAVTAQTSDGKALSLEALAPISCLPSGTQKPGYTWKMGALVADQETWLALRVFYPELTARQEIVLQWEVTWSDTAGKRQQQTLTTHWKARTAPGTVDAWAQARCQEVEAARLQQEALKAAKMGDMKAAHVSLDALRMCGVNNAYVKAVSQTLDDLVAQGDLNALSKEATYASNAMLTRSVSTHERADRLDNDPLGLRKARQGKA